MEKHCDILENEKFGRYLIANKDLDAGEIIFTDTPFVFGPKSDTPPLCLACYCPVENTVCSRCGWPICSEACEKAAQHQAECDVFLGAKVKFQPPEDWSAPSPQLDCITPLRMLIAKEKNPDRWQQELDVMETHTGERIKRPSWAADQNNIVIFLINHCKLGAKFNHDLLEKICGILAVNAVEIPSRGGFSSRAIYPYLAIAAHNCVPNIIHSIQYDDLTVLVRAAVPIKSGETLYLSYTHALSPTIIRREYLLESKYFNCECQRCADPTELGTHLSTIKCSKCDNGVILSSNPLDSEAQWNCTDKHCGFKTSAAAMRKMLTVIQTKVDQLDSLEPGPQAIEQREAFINKYKSVFHPRHSVLLSVKYTLAELYGRVEGYTIDELPDLMLERKVEMCRLVLKTLDVILPGDTRMRGKRRTAMYNHFPKKLIPGQPLITCITAASKPNVIGIMLYELHAPLMYLARSEFGSGLLIKEQLKEKLREPLQCLADAARILQREDPQSPEGIIGNIAYQSMEQLKLSLETL